MEKEKVVFLKPGQSRNQRVYDLRLEKTDGIEGAGSSIIFNPKINVPIEQQQRLLPVHKYKDSILYLLEQYQTLVVLGQTGCGKTTQIPQYLYKSGWADKGYIIGVTQPRRVAAVSVASRMAEELGVTIGSTVGYSIRFEEKSQSDGGTRIKFVTDGHLIREMMYDPLLSKYSVIILDEVHERTVNTDVIMGLMKKILQKRPELRLIISSATMNPYKIANFFDFRKLNKNPTKHKTSYVLSIEGRMHSVDVSYLRTPCNDFVKCSVDACLKLHREENNGDILIFLTGQEQIDYVVSLLKEYENVKSKNNETLLPLPMYSSLSIQEQLKVFQITPVGNRKVVVSTNVAETSITIPNIVYVIDCGLCKMNFYDIDHKIDSLILTPISKDAANQRAGRAGRVRAGKVYRLYPEEYYSKLPDSTVPEIQRCNMAPVVLLLKALGIDKVLTFGFVSPPSARLLACGLQLLFALGIINEQCNLTIPTGVHISEFPIDPMIAKMLYVSGDFGCSEEILIIAAMLQLESIYYILPNRKREAEKSKMRFAVKEGDHISYINIYRSFIENNKDSSWCKRNHLNFKALLHAEQIKNNLKKLLKQHKIPIESSSDDVQIRKCITAGFFSCVAKYHPNGEYRSVGSNKPLHIHPLSVLCYDVPPTWVIYNQIICSKKDYMRDITVIDPLWLKELAPHYYSYGTEREISSKITNHHNF